jgi:hypothetical protein
LPAGLIVEASLGLGFYDPQPILFALIHRSAQKSCSRKFVKKVSKNTANE